MIAVRDTPEGALFAVRVTPRASRTAVPGIYGEGTNAALKVALQAPPVEGKANAALVEFLSDLLGVPRASIVLRSGEHSRTKTVLIRGQSAAAIAVLLEQALPGTTAG